MRGPTRNLAHAGRSKFSVGRRDKPIRSSVDDHAISTTIARLPHVTLSVMFQTPAAFRQIRLPHGEMSDALAEGSFSAKRETPIRPPWKFDAKSPRPCCASETRGRRPRQIAHI
jgi:hypothetical protein